MFETNYRKPFVYAIAVSLVCLLVLAISVGHPGGARDDDFQIVLDMSGESAYLADAAPDGESVTLGGDMVPAGPSALAGGRETKSEEAIRKGNKDVAGNHQSPQPASTETTTPSNTVPYKTDERKTDGEAPIFDAETAGRNISVVDTLRRNANSSRSNDNKTSDDRIDPNTSSAANQLNSDSQNKSIPIGNGSPDLGEPTGDLDFLSELSKGLLSEGHQALLIPTTKVNAKEFMERVQEAAKQSTYHGNVRVHVNFGLDGQVASMRITDEVDESLKNEAERIITSSGNIYNQSGGIVYMYIPVTLGQ